MLNRLEQRNRELWAGHSHILEDLTHTIGGLGLGLLLYPPLRKRSKPVAYSLILLSTAAHVYADMVKPPRTRLVHRVARRLGARA